MASNDTGDRVVRGIVTVVGVLLSAVVGYILFVVLPDDVTAFGVLLFVATVLVGGRLATRAASNLLPSYTVAEVAVEGPISRDGGSRVPTGPIGQSADDIVEQVERADDDGNARALLVKLNTPGGEVVPSDDIRNAVVDFDGPTVAYATDTCASGGYWIASGCDELWARDASIVGSIGVIGSRVNAKELADELGVSYERLAAGKFKDAGLPLKELTDEERDYLQGIIDGLYEDFVERVAEGRGMDSEFVRETEARVYLGQEAHELGLVDDLGTREDVLDRIEALTGEEAVVREFEPSAGLRLRFMRGVRSVAYSLGTGVGSSLGVDDEFRFRL